MDNATLQSLISTYGSRIFCINLDNNRIITIGYTDGTALEDISLATVDNVDFIVVSRTARVNGTEIKYKIFHVSSTVQYVGIMDEGYADYAPDPLTFR